MLRSIAGHVVITAVAVLPALQASGQNAASPNLPAQQAIRTAPQSVTEWTTGDYQYDGAGNIIAIGSDVYRYDEADRLVSATAGPGRLQQYAYDSFGNLTTIATDNDSSTALHIGVNPRTNRADLRLDAFQQPYNAFGDYDAAGNMTSYLGLDTFAYDAASMVTEARVGGARQVYVYGPTDERIAVVHLDNNNTPVDYRFTLRDVDGKVLRDVEKVIVGGAASWQWNEDYIYDDGMMLAAEVNAPERTRHIFVDHLGTPRLTTGNGGAKLALHTYYGFGREATDALQDSEKKKFTGHERDFASLDYMHARYYNPQLGRFLSVDPDLDTEKTVPAPQMWNRYAYVSDSPLNKFDRDGRDEADIVIKPPRPETLARWTPAQRNADNLKNQLRAEAAGRGELEVTPVNGRSTLREAWIRQNGPVPKGQHVDHIIDRQLSPNAERMENAGTLDGSVNMSNGARTKNAIKGLPPGTKIRSVSFAALGIVSDVVQVFNIVAFDIIFKKQWGREPTFIETIRFVAYGERRSTEQIIADDEKWRRGPA